MFDWRNRIGLDARLEPSTVGEVALAIQPWEQVPPGEMAIFDRGFSGYRYFALVSQRRAHFIGRCSTGSFRAAQELLRLNRANQSKGVWLFAPADQKGECRRRGLPLQMQVRVVSVRLADQRMGRAGHRAAGRSPLSDGGIFDRVSLAVGTRDLLADAQGPAGNGAFPRADLRRR